jgi:cadmium resistance protein CadD (predicted permease)
MMIDKLVMTSVESTLGVCLVGLVYSHYEHFRWRPALLGLLGLIPIGLIIASIWTGR